jgi:hypothetical protein
MRTVQVCHENRTSVPKEQNKCATRTEQVCHENSTSVPKEQNKCAERTEQVCRAIYGVLYFTTNVHYSKFLDSTLF